ncbi:MAG: hypothetical protein GF368_04185 [Candidatus Aenigmarchaeota archaeon]|nr:hypothetical protein [Candidatus Aenigmarchaeota archaeon]
MKKADLISYTQDFISLLFQGLDTKIVRSIVLFGSVSRGDFDKNSDVDLFVDLYDEKNSDKVEEIIESVKFDFEEIKKRKWNLRNIDLEIICTVGNLLSENWKSLRKSIESSGIVLYGKFNDDEEKTHYTMIKYNLSSLEQKDKMKVIRDLFGYRKEVNDKTYEKKGLVRELGGRKIENGVFIIPNERSKEILDYLKEMGVEFEIEEIWSE